MHIFFAQRSTKKIKGVTDAGLRPRPIRSVAVLGGGLMGSGIATACALAGINVVIKEINQKFLEVSVSGSAHLCCNAGILHSPEVLMPSARGASGRA